jgi:hypothetical protein
LDSEYHVTYLCKCHVLHYEQLKLEQDPASAQDGIHICEHNKQNIEERIPEKKDSLNVHIGQQEFPINMQDILVRI